MDDQVWMSHSPKTLEAAGHEARRPLVPALQNAISIINFLNDNPPHIATLAELSLRLRITKSHCHSILKTLVEAGWLRFDERTKTYGIHSGLIASGSSLLGSPVLTRIRERLDQLALRTRYPGILTQPQKDGSFVVIESFSAPRSIEFTYPIGFHFPKDAPAQSRAVIAWLGDDRISVWLDRLEPRSFTSKTIVSRAAVEQELRDIRERGYSRSIGEHYDSMAALALPIFDRNGDVAYLLCVMGILDAIRKHERDLARAMQDTVLDIHQAILAKPPRSFQL